MEASCCNSPSASPWGEQFGGDGSSVASLMTADSVGVALPAVQRGGRAARESRCQPLAGDCGSK